MTVLMGQSQRMSRGSETESMVPFADSLHRRWICGSLYAPSKYRSLPNGIVIRPLAVGGPSRLRRGVLCYNRRVPKHRYLRGSSAREVGGRQQDFLHGSFPIVWYGRYTPLRFSTVDTVSAGPLDIAYPSHPHSIRSESVFRIKITLRHALAPVDTSTLLGSC